jgi:hypothetical protein
MTVPAVVSRRGSGLRVDVLGYVVLGIDSFLGETGSFALKTNK